MCLGPEIVALAQTVAAVTAVAGGTVTAVSATQQASASRDAERARKKQVQLEAFQARRKAIRENQQRRADALTNIAGATGGGGLIGDQSATGGITSALGSTLGTQLGEINQAERNSSTIFNANARLAQAQALGATGSAIGSFGKDLFNSAPEIGRIGATLFGKTA